MAALTLEGLTKTFPRAGVVADAIDLRIAEREFFTLLGPSGCGKSTVLRMIAGFEQPDKGRILFRERDVTHEPPNRRNIGFVFQNYALFPHMPVSKNVSFGLEVRKVPAAKVRERVATVMEQVHLTGLEKARIDQLSGGQQQRVALARALVIDPEFLLLDEPLSNLDAKLREQTRAALRAIHESTGVTTIYVTHDQTEAMAMSDRIAVLNNGRIQQVGVSEEIYSRPANRFVADFIGRNNLIDATVESVDGRFGVVRFPNGRELHVETERRAAGLPLNPGARVGVCLRAESLRFTADRGTFEGTVEDVEYVGPVRSCMVRTDLGALQIEVAATDAHPARGETAHLAVKEHAAHLVEPA